MKESEIINKLEMFKNALIKKNEIIENLNLKLEEKDKEIKQFYLSITTDVLNAINTLSEICNKNLNIIKTIEEKLNNIKVESFDYDKILNALKDYNTENSKLVSYIKDLTSYKVVDSNNIFRPLDDVDDMMKKIHTSNVQSSIIDDTMKSIKKGEKLFKHYSFGVANKETLRIFIEFIKSLYSNSIKKGRFFILNNPMTSKSDLKIDDNTFNTFMSFLLDNSLIESRTAGNVVEYLSTFSFEELEEKISEENSI